GIVWESSRLGQSKALAEHDILHSGCGGRKGRYSYRRREVPMRQDVYAIFAAMPEPREGRVWPDRRIRTAFENAVARAGLKDFRFHDLRHHFASWFMMRGGDLLALQKNLGHRTLAMTQKYAHLSPDYLRSAWIGRRAGRAFRPMPSAQNQHKAVRSKPNQQ